MAGPLDASVARPEAREEAMPTRYDAFISYSHAADGRLASELQSALHSFAKPWYRLRALRVFRDQASLSANPALWTSIQRALEDSKTFVLLASPEAAASEWVAREVRWWRTHKPIERLLLLLTDGQIDWDGQAGDFDRQTTDALPPTLAGAFAEEPRWIDLRWARSATDVSLRDPRFRDAVADVAGPLHGRPKDELIGEDVRQHRRTVRLVRATVAILTLLMISAVATAIFAFQQRDLARKQARVALSRQLAAQSSLALQERLDRSLLLSLEALRASDTTEARSALLTALQRNPKLDGLLWSTGSLLSGPTFSSDGRLVAAGRDDGKVELWDARRGNSLGVLATGRAQQVLDVAFSPSSTTLAVGLEDGTTVLFDVRRRHVRAQLSSASRVAPADPVTGVAFDPDGRLLATAGILGSVILWDPTRGRRVRRLQGVAPGWSQWDIAFSPEGNLLATTRGDGAISLWDLRSGGPRRRFIQLGRGGQRLAFSPDGSRLLSSSEEGGISVLDPRRGRWFPSIPPTPGERTTSLAFGAGRLVLGSDDGKIVVFDARRLRRVGPALRAGGVDASNNVAFGPTGQLGSLGEGGIALWRLGATQALAKPLSSDRATEVAVSVDGRRVAWAADNGRAFVRIGNGRPQRIRLPEVNVPSLTWSPSGTVLAGLRLHDSRAVVIDTAEGRLIRLDGPELNFVTFLDETRLLGWDSEDRLHVWDLSSRHPRVPKAGPALGPVSHVNPSIAVSGDGTVFAFARDNGLISLLDTRRFERLVEPIPAPDRKWPPGLALTRDGGLLAATDAHRRIVLWDVRRHRIVGQLRHREASTPTGANVVALAFSYDGKLLASGEFEPPDDTAARIVLWDIRSLRQIGSLPADTFGVSQLEFTAADRLVSLGTEDGIKIWDVGLASWRRRACAIANRDLTQDEWQQFVGGQYHPTCSVTR
jgi:WD40 repeat protein